MTSVAGDKGASGKVKHSLFLRDELRKLEECFLDVTIVCTDGNLRKNKLLVSLLFPYLDNCPEFSSPDLETFIILPDYRTEELKLQMDRNIFGEVPQLVFLEQKSWGTIENITESRREEEVNDGIIKVTDTDKQSRKSLLNFKSKASLIDSSNELIGDTIGVPEELNLLNIFGGQHQFSCMDNCYGIGIPMEDVTPKVGQDSPKKMPRIKEMFPCDICGNQFNKYQLVIHSNTHNKPIYCKYCDKSFARLKSCRTHEVNIHGDTFETIVEIHENGAVKKFKPDGNLHPCIECGKTFAAHSHLESHQRTHTKEKPYQCSSCLKGFTAKGNLIAHERIHAGTHKRFPCSECDKMFSHPSEVKNHMVVHTDLRTHVCEHCGTSYRRYSNLWRHSKKCPRINDTIDAKAKDKVILVAPITADQKTKKKRSYSRRKPRVVKARSDKVTVLRDPLEVDNKPVKEGVKLEEVSVPRYRVINVNKYFTKAPIHPSEEEELTVEGEVLIEDMELIEEIKDFT